MNVSPLQSLLLLAAPGLPLLAALALTIASWRGAAMRATPVAAVPALLLVVAGQIGASLHVPFLGQHAVLGLDAVGRIFLGFTSVLWLTSGWYARAYLAEDPNPVRFHLFFLLAMAGNFGLILAADVPTFYVGFTLMGLASAGLVFHRGGAEAAESLRWSARLTAVGGRLVQIENTLRARPVAGAALLLLIGLILGLLAAP